MNKKFLFKTWLLLALMVLGVSSAWAEEEVYKTALFGKSYNSKTVSGYTDSWRATNGDFVVNLTNFNNNSSSWDYVKCGRKDHASTATIITDAAIDQAITKVVVTIDALTVSNVNSIKLYTSSNNSTWTEAGSFTKAKGAQEVSLSSPTAGLYYKIEFDCASGSSNGLVTVSKVEYYYNNASAIPAVATIGDLDVDVLNFGAEGTFNPTITLADGVTANDYTVTWDEVDEAQLILTENGEYIAGTTKGSVDVTVHVTPDDLTAYEAVSKTFTVKVKDPNAHSGLTQADAFTVAEAIEAIDNNDYDSNTTYFVKGIISQVDSYNSTYSSITYWISDDGTTNNQFECYSGLGLNGAGFTGKEDLTTGIAVIVKGNMKKYNSTYEFNYNNEIVWMHTPEDIATINGITPTTINVKDTGGFTLDIDYADGTTSSDYTVTITSSDDNVLTVDNAGSYLAGDEEGQVTITVTVTPTDNTAYKAVSETFEITIADSREDAGLAWSETTLNVALNAEVNDYTLPTLTNPHSLTVTYESSDDNIAKVVGGEIILETANEGEVTITANFAGDNVYKPAHVSYTITIYNPNAKGTLYNPYTVAEVKAMTSEQYPSGAVYVKGFIVGCYDNGSFSNFTRTGAFASNLAIADDPTESDKDKTLPIQLGTDQREGVNVKDNPHNIGVTQVVVNGTITSYMSKTGVKNLTEKPVKVAESISVNSSGYATYYTDVALDFTGLKNMFAYTAEVSEGKVNFTKVDKVPANTGVLLRNPNGLTATNVVPVADSATGTSAFVGTLEDIAALASVDGEYSNFILNNGNSGIGFYPASGKKVAAHKAYLHVETSALAKGLTFIGFDDATGIELMEVENNNAQMFNLAGQRVGNDYKGIVIINGKKVRK